MFISQYQKHVLAQTMSQGNRGMHVRESYRSPDVWQSLIINCIIKLVYFARK